MPAPAPDRRDRLLQRLGSDLLTQSYHHEWHTGNQEQLQDLEKRIQATAKQLQPEVPQAAIRAARRKLAYDDLANQLVRRADLPADPAYAPEPLRIKTEHLERKILDLARKLDPSDARKAIAHATPIAHEYLARQMHSVHNNPAHHLEPARRLLDQISLRLSAFATAPEPPQHQRVHQTLMALRRQGRLHAESRTLAQSRGGLLCRGNAHELRARFEKLPDPRRELDPFLERVFRHPERARRRLGASYHQTGDAATFERLADNPAVFGRLRGRQIHLYGNTPSRTKALNTAEKQAKAAAKLCHQRDKLDDALESVSIFRDLHAQNRELIQAFPDRESLLTDLGRHMEGLEMHEVQPLLQKDQAKLVQEVRHAEQHFLEPLRNVTRRLGTLDPGQARINPEIRKAAALFQEAPRHILRRLTQPQKSLLLMATSMARSVAKKASKVANP